MNQPERQVYYKVPAALYAELIAKLKSSTDFAVRRYIPESEDCHFVRYSFIFNAEKVSIVYDTKAAMLTVTAFREAIDIVDTAYKKIATKLEKRLTREKKDTKPKSLDRSDQASEEKTNDNKTKKTSGIAQVLNTYARDERFSDNTVEKRYISYNYQDILKSRNNSNNLSSIALLQTFQKTEPTPALTSKVDTARAKNADQKESDTTANKDKKSPTAKKSEKVTKGASSDEPKSKSSTTKTAAPARTPAKATKSAAPKKAKAVEPKKPEAASKSVPVASDASQAKPALEYKDGFAVKIVNLDIVKHIIKELKERTDLKFMDAGTVKSTTGAITTYSIENASKQKVFLRHLIRKNMFQLQGKSSELFSEIQALISIDQKAYGDGILDEQKDAYKEVKKALPAAYDFLSEQSKIDFTIGLIDIYSDEVRLSDYSVLLVPPYRGLERLLFDLQIAKGIEVKMIGQAYEKEDGFYTLKSGYKRKIDSIVYNEVMAALYTEYFEKRNFYAHSNNTDQLSVRVIADKSQAKAIFENLLNVINYNCKKLKEIGLSIV